jgi:hypothetical protein
MNRSDTSTERTAQRSGGVQVRRGIVRSGAAVALLVVLTCGCGSSASARSQVEAKTHDYVLAGVLKMDPAGTTSDFLCTNVGDLAWRCLGQIAMNGASYDVVMRSTCDGGSCAYELVSDTKR